ncbi:hypothetical protein B0T26DRAFT_652963 [Lasiosphaeria miniovina]|uniref:Uncharacterized protein n=1 Tax=Lasiosphaeria miniovina TaxID=1954250 RepID=A0AA39ZPC3_9PEZI|nr:uncharacterized protein B0T26DRAFT_763695 [Lasiosphaeria miniovina]XP_060293657.1 uncharacterized protein B0T26DRAFT_652963 [Lasiosphaeria miniovina]KAK0701093.1 hypothetical protein B0T26DRAFT_763695 [Lasiosphaeria miniovina]KAK0710353.1 hypothetical protein B0T26DRAFT_652963 [Lasiosphaeria miniovina]
MDPCKVLQPHGVLICKSCRYACLIQEVTNHLRTKHRHLSAQQRATIQKAVGRLPSLFHNQDSLNFFTLPACPVPAILDLAGPHFDGLKCDRCQYIARQDRLTQEHCRIAHDWVNPRKPGRTTREIPAFSNPWRSGVPCQRFFSSRRASGWFEVIIPDASLPGSPGT